jgi:isopenicillin N synthase-like dioxygenase
MSGSPQLPTIDLSLFDIGDPWRDHVAAQIDWAASTYGAFQLVGHSVDGGLIDNLLELGSKYVKRGVAGSDLPGFHDGVRQPDTDEAGARRLLTLVKLGDSRGLQAKLDDSWTDVPALPGALLCSVGPVLERLTQRRFRHAPLRLSRSVESERPSLCFVFEPGMGAVLTPLAELSPRPSADASGRYALAARC